MTPDKVIEEIWKMKWYEVAKVAFTDDFILLYKIWPIWLLLFVAAVVIVWGYCNCVEIKGKGE